ncbi:tail fiber domain-containing protein [Allomeiothermus silvanus]|uniref:tail fiber domain-containing protein n=1 Tax=Allomeiothermus silvanus TaxID=52022 RepID=UPI002355B653|nr:tail fiber domain-containing protein [Allomeiothermus silvanus]
MKGSNLQYFLIGAFVVASGLSVLAVTIPNTFTAGSPIKAAEVNANFSALKNAVDPLESFKAKLSSTPCASGQAMSGVGADGSSSCVALGPGGGGLTKVEHDNTLSGDGTAVSKLGINLPLNLVTSASDAYVLKVENKANKGFGIFGLASGDQANAVIGVLGQTVSSGGFGVYGLATNDTAGGTGVYGQVSAGTGYGVAGLNQGLTGPGYGVLGQNRSTSDNASAIRGEALGTSGRTVGVAGIAQASPLGTGVYGLSSTGFGMHAVSSGDGVNGSALWAEARSSKTGVAIYATNNNAGPTLVLNNAGSGDLVQAFNGGNLNFKVLNSGNVVFPQTLGQKLNLWGSDYGIGVQLDTMYFRINNAATDKGGFAWYKGGTHSDNTLDTGGGTRLMWLDRNANLEIIGEVYGKQFNNTSDRNAKANFRRVDSLEVLGKVARLPITSWNYKSDPANVRHIGPTAQDFKAAFGLNGADDKHISTIDEGGVALAAIQGLYELNRQLTNENKALQERLTALEQRLAALEAR